MSEDKAAPDMGAEETSAGENTANRWGKKKLALFAALAVLLLGGGGVVAWKTHLLPFPGKGKVEAEHGDVRGGAARRLLLSVPSATANLDNGAGRTVYVKMTASVEVEGAQSLSSLQGRLPEVEDIFQTYLHESRPQDLHGSGFYRLREALLRRLRVAFAPLDVTSLYITELLTQ